MTKTGTLPVVNGGGGGKTSFALPIHIVDGGAAYRSVGRTAIRSPLSLPSHPAAVHGTFSDAGAPLCRYPDMIVNSARAFIPISDISVTAKSGDISGDSSSRGQDTGNGDCPRKPGTVPRNRRRLVTLVERVQSTSSASC